MIHIPPLVEKPLRISWEFHWRVHQFWILIQRQQWKNDFLHQKGHEDHFSNLEDIMNQIFRIWIGSIQSFLSWPTPHCNSHLLIPQHTPSEEWYNYKFDYLPACIYCADLSTIYTALRVYLEELWYLSCNGVQGIPTFSDDCSNYFKSCDYPTTPPPQKKKKKKKKKNKKTSSETLEASVSLTNTWTQPSRASFYFYQELFPLCSLITFHRC